MNSILHSSAASLTAISMDQTGLVPTVLPAPAPTEEVGRGRGRPGLLTGELAVEMYKLIRVYGLTDSRAGLMAGASTSSVSRWKEEDPEFGDYLETARAEFEVDRTLKLLEATRPDGSPDWRAHAWLLKNAQREEGRKPGRPRRECESVSVSERAGGMGGLPSSKGAPGSEIATQKIPENAAPSGTDAPAAGTETSSDDSQKFPENNRSRSGPAPVVLETVDEYAQKIPENRARSEEAAPQRPAMRLGAHEKIPENRGRSARDEAEEAA